MTPLFIKRLCEARESGTHGLVALAADMTATADNLLHGLDDDWSGLAATAHEVAVLLADPTKDGQPIPDMDVIAEHLAVKTDEALSAFGRYWDALCDALDAVREPALPTVREQVERWKTGQTIAAAGREYNMARMTKSILRAGGGR